MLNLGFEELEALERDYGTVPQSKLLNEAQSCIAYDQMIGSPYACMDEFTRFYGGAFIDEEGMLVVISTDSGKQFSGLLEKAIGGAKYHIQPGSFSYQYLKSVYDAICAYMICNNDSDRTDNLAAVTIDDSGNRVIVDLFLCDEDSKNDFRRKVLDTPVLVYREAQGRVEFAVNINPGSPIDSGSVGYRVGRSGGVYVITAAHLYSAVGNTAYIGGTAVGSVIGRALSDCDAALVQITNPNYTPTNAIASSSSTLSTTMVTPLAGTTIFKSGASTSVTSGTVTAASSNQTISGNYITDMFVAATVSGTLLTFGDSGGVAYDTSYRTAGIATGVLSASPTVGYFSKASNIFNHFQAARY